MLYGLSSLEWKCSFVADNPLLYKGFGLDLTFFHIKIPNFLQEVG